MWVVMAIEKTPAGYPVHDALIVGAGPAGVACAVWLARLGLGAALLDAAGHVGGLCHGNPFPDPWSMLVPAADGHAIATELDRSLRESGATLLLDHRVERIVQARAPSKSQVFMACVKDGDAVFGHAVVLATGVRPRAWRLGLDAAGNPFQDVLVGPGARVARHDYAGKRVAILGGGDNAFENALYVAGRGASGITLYARSVRAQRQLQEKVPAQWVRRGRYAFDPETRSVDGQRYDVVLVFYGWEPALDLAQELDLALDERGFVATDRYTAETSVGGIYAAGELAGRQHPCVLTAMADGVVVAKAVQARREARDG